MSDRPTAATITDQQLADLHSALDRVHHVADLIAAGAPWTANHDDLAGRIREAATTTTESATPAPDNWKRILDGFQSLLDAFPRDLHNGGPAIQTRRLPAQLVDRWRQRVHEARSQLADQTAGK